MSIAGDQFLGMMNIFVDPASAVKRIHRKASWLWPLLLVSAGTIILSLLSLPIVMRVMTENPPAGMPAGQIEKSIGMIETMQRVSIFFTPVLLAGIWALLAWVLSLVCSVAGMNARFRDLFSLLAHCALIPLVGQIAGFIVVSVKADQIESLAELKPAFGLDLLFHDGIDRQLLAVLNYFSMFTIWYIIVLAVGLAHLAGVSKSKAFLASIPVWLLPLPFMVAGSFFQP
jgi:hypothetical protein